MPGALQRVPELAEEVACLGNHIAELLRAQIVSVPSDRRSVGAAERRRQCVLGHVQVTRECVCHGRWISGELFVPELERCRIRSARRNDVSSPSPRGPARVARALEFLASIRLDPEPCVRPVGDARVVDSRLLRAEPRFLEKGTDDVSPVPDDVHDAGIRVRDGEDGRKVRELGCLLDSPHGSHEADPSRDHQDPAQAPGSLFGLQRRELGNSRLDGRDLAEIHEARQRPDRASKKRRSRARRPDDEHQAVIESSEPLAQRRTAPRHEPLRDAELEGGGFEQLRHGRTIVAASDIDRRGALVDSVGTTRDGTQWHVGMDR